MKPPIQCTCPVHLAADLSKYSRNLKLLRRVRRDSLEQAAKCRKRAAACEDLKEAGYQEMIAICAEWSAWICLTILREIKTEAAA